MADWIGVDMAQSTCPVCGQSLSQPSRGRRPIYCSRSCGQKARYEARTPPRFWPSFKCRHCGTEVAPRRRTGGPQPSACSERCSRAAYRDATRQAINATRREEHQRELAGITKTCKHCGSEFTPAKSRRQQFCTKKCGSDFHRDSSGRVCKEAGCDRPERARGLCSSHYNQTHQADRHQKALVPCTHCGELTLKFKSGSRKPFCDLGCRDLYRLEHPYRPRPTIHDQPAWPDWMGSACTLAEYACRECGVVFFGRPTVRRAKSAFCTARCRHAFKRHGRRNIKKAKRIAIFERDAYMCWLCDKPCGPVESFPDPLSPTIDHVIPRSRGGSDDADNLACAHFICNSTRQDSWSFPEVAVA